MRERIKKLEDREDKHAEITAALQWKNGNLNRQLRRAKRDIEDLEEENRKHAVEKNKVNIIIERRNLKIKELERNLNSRINEAERLTLENEKLNRDIEDLTKRNKEIAIEMNKAITTISDRDIRINDLKLELERNERLQSDANDMIAKLRCKLEIKTEEAEELQDQLIANEDESNRVQTRLESKLEAKEKELKAAQQQIMEFKQRKGSRNQHRQQIIELRQKLDAVEKVARDKNTIIERKKHIIEQMKRNQSSEKVENQLALNQKSQKLKDFSEQIERYRGATMDLKNLAELFPSARIKDVDWVSSESDHHLTIRTKQLQKYKDHIASHSKYAKLPDGKYLMENNPMHDRKCDYKEHELEAFKLFVEWNGIGNRKPTTMNESDIIALGYVNESAAELEDVIEVRIVAECPALPFLVGQKGTFAKMDIDEGVILGQYLGREMLEEEYHAVYNGTREEKDHLTFANGAELMVDDKIITIIIDAFPAYKDSPLLYINDGRENIRDNATPRDEERINTEFVSVLCNGWPMVLLRTTKPLKAGNQLFIHYGETYNGALDQIHTIDDQQKKMKREVTHILNKYGLTQDIYSGDGIRCDPSVLLIHDITSTKSTNSQKSRKRSRKAISPEAASVSGPKMKRRRVSKKCKRKSNAAIPRPKKKSRPSVVHIELIE